MQYDYIFWDWNGTLLDDFDANLFALNTSLRKYNLPEMAREAYGKSFRFPVVDFYVELGFPYSDYAHLAEEFTKNYDKMSDTVKLYPEVREVLERIAHNNIKQVILSASNEGILLKQLKKTEIESYFAEILGLSDLLAYSKLERGRLWRKTHLKEKVLMIGDSEHDFEVASALNFDCILVSREHNDKDKLRKTEVRVIDSLAEIVDFLS